jgi:hypothetical protein
MSTEQGSADNYAVLFVGGGDADNNYPRYFNSLKGIYEIAEGQFELPPENIYVLYADGKNSSPDKNIVDEIKAKSKDLSTDDAVKYLNSLVSSSDFRLTDDDVKKLQLAIAGDIIKSDLLPGLVDLQKKINAAQDRLQLRLTGQKIDGKADEFLVDLSVLEKSDLSFANGSRIMPGNGPSLKGALNDLSIRVDENDHVFFWTCDHGGFGDLENMVDVDGNIWSSGRKADDFSWGRRDVGNKSILNGWGDEIGNAELAQWIAPIIEKSGYTTLAYNQCFAGGMLDASRPALASAKNAYGMAAANAYEESIGYSFAEGVRLALKGSRDPKANRVFASAKASDLNAATYAYADNDGERNDLEHPWAFGGTNGDFSIFSVGNSQHPLEKYGVELLENSQPASRSNLDQRNLLLKEDTSIDLRAALAEQFGPDVVVEAIEWPTHGSLEMLDGALTYVPMVDYHGTELLLLRYSTPSRTGELLLSVGVQAVNDAPLVSDDVVNMDAGTKSVKFSIDSQPGYFGDVDPDGDNLRISSFSSPKNGRLEKVGTTGFRYKPNTGFVGTDSFLYQVTDGEAYSVAEVSISVGGGAFSLDPFDGFYQLTSEGADPIVNPLRARDGTLLSDESSERWDVVAAVSDGSTYRLLLQGEGRREGYYRVWTADESGQLLNQRKRWLTADQIENKAYDSTFLGVVTSSLDPSDVFASSGLM